MDTLPDPSGPLSASVSPAVIKVANEAVRSATTRSKPRGRYAKFTPEQKALIGEYASLHGNQAAIRVFFPKKLEVKIKLTSVQTWKGKYQAELSRKRKAGETCDLSMKSLPIKKRGRPLLLAEKLDTEVKCYIQVVCDGGGVINMVITMAAATAIVKKADRNLLADNGGLIIITSNWAKSLLHRMNFVKKRGSSTAKLSVTNFEAVKEQFVLDVNAVVEMEDIPPELVFN